MSVFDLVAGSALMLTELLGDLLRRVTEAANPPPPLIPSLLPLWQGHYRPAAVGSVAGIEKPLVCTTHRLTGKRVVRVWVEL